MAAILRRTFAVFQLLVIVSLATRTTQLPTTADDESSIDATTTKITTEPSVRIKCLSGYMLIVIRDAPTHHDTGLFSGMVYPKGLSKNSTCLVEYREHQGLIKYKLPLRSCNTMPQERIDGGIEFFNTIVLQPHLKLITDLGRGYHVRCAYKSRDAATKKHRLHNVKKPEAFRSADSNVTVSDRRDYGRSLEKSLAKNANDIIENDDADLNEDEFSDSYGTDGNDDPKNDKPMPGCHMKIYNSQYKIADDVKIGDPLTIVVSIDEQPTYGLHVTDCIVRDGLGWGEQRLLAEDGCPMDNEIMGQFNYTDDGLAANVTFPAHKFPYTTSVYYQCNVRLCARNNPDCRASPQCNGKRPKRQAKTTQKEEDGLPATIEVYSGLYVNENIEVNDNNDESVSRERTLDDALCISQHTFAIAIAIAGLILMLAVVAAVLCIMAKRSTKSVSNSGSSIYSGPYTNTAFSRSS